MLFSLSADSPALGVGDEFQAEISFNPKATNPAKSLGIAPEFFHRQASCFMRVFVIENYSDVTPEQYEMWQARVTRTAMSSKEPPRRCEGKEIVFIKLMKRIEKVEEPRFNPLENVIERVTLSGDHIVKVEKVPATKKRAEYQLGEHGVVSIEEITGGDLTVYSMPICFSRNEYLGRLRKQFANIVEPRRLCAMLNKLPQAPSEVLAQVHRYQLAMH